MNPHACRSALGRSSRNSSNTRCQLPPAHPQVCLLEPLRLSTCLGYPKHGDRFPGAAAPASSAAARPGIVDHELGKLEKLLPTPAPAPALYRPPADLETHLTLYRNRRPAPCGWRSRWRSPRPLHSWALPQTRAKVRPTGCHRSRRGSPALAASGSLRQPACLRAPPHSAAGAPPPPPSLPPQTAHCCPAPTARRTAWRPGPTVSAPPRHLQGDLRCALAGGAWVLQGAGPPPGARAAAALAHTALPPRPCCRWRTCIPLPSLRARQGAPSLMTSARPLLRYFGPTSA